MRRLLATIAVIGAVGCGGSKWNRDTELAVRNCADRLRTAAVDLESVRNADDSTEIDVTLDACHEAQLQLVFEDGRGAEDARRLVVDVGAVLLLDINSAWEDASTGETDYAEVSAQINATIP